MKTRSALEIAASLFLALSSLSGVEPELPRVPEGFKVELYAKEPLVRNPGALAFDSRGRLFVGYGPQYRSPKPDTPGDSVAMMIDSDGDGIADSSKIFATGLNCIQGMAWHGRDLWIGNSPDLTIARDLDGDDVADEYVRVYTDLGNLEHGNHGHNWAPDGKLYFSQGTSKGLTQPGRVAPKAFRELWGVRAPEGTPDMPPSTAYSSQDYELVYQSPKDDWGREGGVLRCDDMGRNLEIVSRGMRNAWDIGFDSGFNWLGSDNDQSEGDRLVMPFFNAHFGWGHGWSAHWTGEGHLPTAPTSGPVFDGSGTGVVYYDHPQMPEAFRGVWFFNDWLRKTTFVYRPRWEGALIQPEGGRWEPFVVGGGTGRSVADYGGASDNGDSITGSLYRPTDIAIGPDGALYIAGWGSELKVEWEDGRQVNEGRIFRISWEGGPSRAWESDKRRKSIAQWSLDDLAEDLGSPVGAWNIDAQDELVRRGGSAIAFLKRRLLEARLSEAAETWTIWALGRISPFDTRIDDWLGSTGRNLSLNARIQAIRIAAHRIREHRTEGRLPDFSIDALSDADPRVRFAGVQAITQAREVAQIPKLLSLAAREADRVVYYAAWQGLRGLASEAELRRILGDRRPGVRRAAMLALFESGAMDEPATRSLMEDSDTTNAALAANWVAKQSGNELIDLYPEPGVFVGSVDVRITPGIKPADIHYTEDGSEPSLESERGHPGTIDESVTLKIGLFVDGKQLGNTLVADYTKSEKELALAKLAPIEKPTGVAETLALLAQADISQGPGLFNAAGCISCHRAGELGRAIGPDLSSLGQRDDVDSAIRSILHPNQIIVEGYSLLTVVTDGGESFAGVLDSETDRHLKIIQLDARAATIEKSSIISRRSAHVSPMPPYEEILSPQQLADLVAWLMSGASL